MIRMSTTKETKPIPYSPKRLTRTTKPTETTLENGLRSAAFAKALPFVDVLSRWMAGLILPKNGLCSIERELKSSGVTISVYKLLYIRRVCLDTAYGWKHCSKIIFKLWIVPMGPSFKVTFAFFPGSHALFMWPASTEFSQKKKKLSN